MTPWPRAAAAYPKTLVLTCLVAPVYSRRRLNDVFDQIFLKLEFNPPFSSARFSLRHFIFAQMKGCHIFEVETQTRIIRKPHFLLNLSQKKKKNQKKRCLFTSEKL